MSKIQFFFQKSKFFGKVQHTIFSENGKVLSTCALRPNGIYGENEKKHLPRIADRVEQGVTIVKFGFGITLLDWCHVDNLVQVKRFENFLTPNF